MEYKKKTVFFTNTLKGARCCSMYTNPIVVRDFYALSILLIRKLRHREVE